MMEGILILAHGSQRLETEATLASIVTKVRRITGNDLVEPAFLQFSARNLEAGISALMSRGATDIRVVPMFIFDGVHVTQDIPAELAGIGEKHPQLKLRLCGHIGDDDRLAAIVADRAGAV